LLLVVLLGWVLQNNYYLLENYDAVLIALGDIESTNLMDIDTKKEYQDYLNSIKSE